MLLSNFKNLFINNTEVKSAYLNGTQLFSSAQEDINPFDKYTWAEIQAIVQNGTVAEVIPLGTTVKIDLGTDHFKGVTEWMVMGYTYNNLPTLVLMPTKILIKTRYQSQTDKLRSYVSSFIYNECNQVISHLPEDIRNVLVERSVKYMDAATSIGTAYFKCIIPSLKEITGLEKGFYIYANEQLAYFNNENYKWDNWFWTRTRNSDNTYQMYLAVNNTGSISTGIATNTSNLFGFVPMLFIG